MSESVTTMPKVVSEISRTEDILKEVQNEMDILTIQLKGFDDKNLSSSEELSRLDILKSNMENSRAILVEHSRWSSIVIEAKNFMESGGKLSDLADRFC
jgi:hypothetical protein